jgi:hypothetical protein
MKKDWSAIRVTVLLYIVIIAIPLNYYFTKESFKSVQNDALTMGHLVSISASLPMLLTTQGDDNADAIFTKIDSSIEAIESNFINFAPNKEFVAIFQADVSFKLLKESYKNLKDSFINQNSDKAHIDIDAFSKTAQEMMTYKMELILDKLYLSLALTMLVLVILIFAMRTYMRLHFLKQDRKYMQNTSSSNSGDTI